MREYRRKGAIGLIELDSVALARAVGAEHRAARAGHDRYAVVADHRRQLHHVIEIPKARRRLGLSDPIGVLERHANNLSREGADYRCPGHTARDIARDTASMRPRAADATAIRVSALLGLRGSGGWFGKPARTSVNAREFRFSDARSGKIQ